MNVHSPSNGEKQSDRAGANAIGAISVADRIAQNILTERPTIAATIVSQRIQRNDYGAIAMEHTEVLEAVGARTHQIRRSIVHRICQACIAPELSKQITHDILARRPTNLTDAQRKIGAEATALYQWTPQIDSELRTAAARMLHTKSPHTGTTDWEAIALHMRNTWGISLTSVQWCSRMRHLRRREKQAQQVAIEAV